MIALYYDDNNYILFREYILYMDINTFDISVSPQGNPRKNNNNRVVICYLSFKLFSFTMSLLIPHQYPEKEDAEDAFSVGATETSL